MGCDLRRRNFPTLPSPVQLIWIYFLRVFSPPCHILYYYRYWWNTRIFPFTKKSCLHRVRILVSPWLLTLILTFWNRNYKYYCLYFSFVTLYPSFITFLWQAFCDRWPLLLHYFAVSKMNKKKLCFSRNFISIYKLWKVWTQESFQK